MQSLNVQGYSYEERQGLLPNLATVFANCGGWVLDRRTLSATTIEFRLELELRSVLELYAALLSIGLELTRSGHLTLTELCTRRKNQAGAADLGQIVSLRLEVSFLEERTLHSLLASGRSQA